MAAHVQAHVMYMVWKCMPCKKILIVGEFQAQSMAQGLCYLGASSAGHGHGHRHGEGQGLHHAVAK
jgi:hypothetical protein